METAIASFKPEDLYHIKISCGCNQKDIAEVPKQMARMLNLHVCSKCSRIFGMQLRDDGGWKIKRIEMDSMGVAVSSEMLRRLGESITRKADEAEAQQSEKDPEPENDWKN